MIISKQQIDAHNEPLVENHLKRLGFLSEEITGEQEIIRKLAGINVVGMDVVEVSPPYDHAEITALAGATIANDLLCLYAANRSKVFAGASRY